MKLRMHYLEQEPVGHKVVAIFYKLVLMTMMMIRIRSVSNFHGMVTHLKAQQKRKKNKNKNRKRKARMIRRISWFSCYIFHSYTKSSKGPFSNWLFDNPELAKDGEEEKLANWKVWVSLFLITQIVDFYNCICVSTNSC